MWGETKHLRNPSPGDWSVDNTYTCMGCVDIYICNRNTLVIYYKLLAGLFLLLLRSFHTSQQQKGVLSGSEIKHFQLRALN